MDSRWCASPGPCAGVQQHLHEAQHAGVVDFDTGDFERRGMDGQRQALEQWKIYVHVQRPSLKGREAVGDSGQGTANLVEVIKAFV